MNNISSFNMTYCLLDVPHIDVILYLILMLFCQVRLTRGGVWGIPGERDVTVIVPLWRGGVWGYLCTRPGNSHSHTDYMLPADWLLHVQDMAGAQVT